MVRVSIDASGLLRVFVIRENSIKSNLSALIQFENKPNDNNRVISELKSKLLPLFRNASEQQLTKLLNLISTAQIQKDNGELIAALKKAEEEILGVYEKM
jgi:hypothetical protein